MSDKQNKINDEELIQATGGKGSLASLGSGPVCKVKGLSSGFLALKSTSEESSAELAQLQNGDVVQLSGSRIRTNGKTYTQVYVPSLKQSGWVDAEFLG